MRFLIKSFILSLLLAYCLQLGANKMEIRKLDRFSLPRKHPYTGLLNKQPDRMDKSKGAANNRLLVILVDFQEETPDDANTTGNGKFLLQPDPSYLTTIGSPPHDQAYFRDNLRALRYYYLAASNGSFDLQFDVYPETGAYTLPHTMGYYNPPGADGSTFVGKMEEYFKTSFELADAQSPEIDFSSYGHFMIIHAGSDWQHDINGDTPSDIPSFFIRVGPGKEAIVDNGTFLVQHACNVPSTISQDFYTQTASNGDEYYGGYGALNAVLAHEFGHSLGMVDLYNVQTFRPMVGVFDIMDSGGSGIFIDQETNAMVEGGLPILPGAWSRLQAFGDYLQANGNVVEVSDLDLFESKTLTAPSHRQNPPANQTQILKIPLSETEYLLVENRNVDPDLDGGTSVKGNEDRRVILHPTPLDDDTGIVTYEYDYFLPSFLTEAGGAVGGGLLVWLINDDVIHNQGNYDSEGNFVSNYDNNTINTRYSERGVQVVEADNITDIGNIDSMYWTGTPYEYFHAHKPLLNEYGLFEGWSGEPWKPEYSGSSLPSLHDSQGLGSIYWLADIGNPEAEMEYSVRTGFFDATQIHSYAEAGMQVGPLVNTVYTGMDSTTLPLISTEGVKLFTQTNGEWNLLVEYEQELPNPRFPIITSDQDADGWKELLIVGENSIELLEFSQDDLLVESINFPAQITVAPLALDNKFFVCTQNSISIIADGTLSSTNEISGIERISIYGDDLAALTHNKLILLDANSLNPNAELSLPEAFGDFEPVSFSTSQAPFVNLLFIMANSGNIYRYDGSHIEQIYISSSNARPSQLGISPVKLDGHEILPVLFWSAGSKIYAIKQDGSLLRGLPYNTSSYTFEPEKHVYSMQHDKKNYLYFPVSGRGHLAFEIQNGLNASYSLISNSEQVAPLFHVVNQTDSGQNLLWTYSDSLGNSYIHSALVDPSAFTLLWNGFRNANNGCFTAAHVSDLEPSESGFQAYVFPNPVRSDNFNLRILNATKDIKINVYTSKASLVFSKTLVYNGNPDRVIALNSSNLAPGVYILQVQSSGNDATLKFAVEK